MSLSRALVASWMLVLVVVVPVHAASRIDLDRGWQFIEDSDGRGEGAGWPSTMPAGAESVNVPHTWNIGRLHDYRGVAWLWMRRGGWWSRG